MNKTYSYAAIALFSGAILAIMIKLNASLAKLNSPLESSWIAHGLGAVTALLLLQFIKSRATNKDKSGSTKKSPWYAYLGGIPGAFTVILAGITVNSSLGLAGTLAFALLGQILFSLLVERFALFGSPKRTLGWQDLKVIGLILIGSFFIIFARQLT